MNAYVSKPFKTDELLLKMATVLENHTLESDKSKRVGKAQDTVTAVVENAVVLPDTVTDMEFLQQFTGGKTDKMNKYIGMFLENAPKLAGNDRTWTSEKRLSFYKDSSHSLKPQLSYMGVKEDISHIFLMEQSAGESAHYERLPQLVENLKIVCEKAFEELDSHQNWHDLHHKIKK